MSGNPSTWAASLRAAEGHVPSRLHVRRAGETGPAGEPGAAASASFAFTLDDLGKLRRIVAAAATGAALEQSRCEDLVLAVDELATNSICHGGGSGNLEIWREGGELVCEVSDAGVIDERIHGRPMPDPDAVSGRGLWLVEKLTDRVEVSSAPHSGSVVRVGMQLA